MKLTYFPVRGRIEPARLMLELAGAHYDMELVSMEKWKAEGKEQALQCTPFGQLPILQDGAFTLCQSQAINRYVARTLGLYGSTAEDTARIDEVAETATGMLENIVAFQWDPQFTVRRPEHRETMGNKLERLDIYFARTSKDAEHWVLPGRYTLADVLMAFLFESILPLHPGLLDGFPRLHHAMTRFFAAGGVREYVRSERRPRLFTAPMAPFGGKPEETHHWTA